MQDESFEAKSEETPFRRPTDISPLRIPRSTDETTLQKIKHILYEFFMIILQILQDYGSRIFLFAIAFVSTTLQPNGIGFIYLTISVLLLILELRTNWNYIWVSYGLVSLTIIGGQIYFLVSESDEGDSEDAANWLGLALLGEDSVSVFVMNSLIFVFSILFGIFIGTTNIVMTDKEYVQVRKKFTPVLHKKLEIMENQEAFGRFSMLMQAHEARPSDIEQLKLEFKSVRVRYYYRKISRFFERFFHRHGYEVCLLFLLILAVYEVNALSVVYTLVAAYFSFSTSYFFRESHAAKLKFLRYQWRFFSFVMAIDLLRQYFFGIWFPLSWNVDRLFADQSFLCDPNAENTYSPITLFANKNDYQVCIENWRTWLTLDTVVNGRLFFYFFTIYFFILYDRYFLPIKTKRDRFEEGDDLDFTNPNNRDIFDHLRFFYYCHFYTIPVLLFIGISMKLNISGRTDLISLLYLVLGLYLLFNYKKLLRERNRIWRIVEIINIIILLTIILFQIPMVPCPVAFPNRSFISLGECAWLHDTLDSDFALSINSSNAFYAIIHVIGLYKISGFVLDDSVYKEVLIVLFFSLAIVQRKIWHHPYIKAYVIPYYEKKDKYNHQIAAKYVERVHLDRIRAHRGVLIDKELAINTERKIENKIKQWEAMFGDFGVPIKDVNEGGEEHEQLIHERSSFDKDERIEECFRIIDKVVKEVPEAKIINVVAFVQLIRRKDYNTEAVLDEIPSEIRKSKQAILKAIRRIKPINLPLRLGKDLVLEGNLAIPEAPMLREEGASLEEIKERDEGEGEATPGLGRGKEAVSQEIGEKKEEEKEKIGEEEDKLKEEEHEPREERVTFEGRRPTEIETVSPMRRSTGAGDLRKSRHFALEEVLLETQSPRGSVRGRDESYGGGTTRVHYGDIMKKEKSEMTVWERLSLWLIKQIRGSGMIGDIQAGLLIGDTPFILLLDLLLVNMDKITFLVFLINFISTPNILSLVFPLSVFFYAAIEYPTPPARYWKTMLVYTALLITIKFLYQSSFFCGTPPFSFNNIFDQNGGSCSGYFRDPGSLALRIDFIIGITKFSGDSSYPRNQGILLGLFWDLVTFFCLVFVRFTLDSAGIWNHLRLYNSFKYVPQLGDALPDEIKSDQHSFFEGQTQSLTEFPRPSAYHPDEGEDQTKTKWAIKNFFRNMFAFNPYATGEAAVRKPGTDYYIYMAPLSLFILLYFICFYSAMVGSSRSLTEELNQSLFSGSVVITIVIIIVIMLLERTLYIARENVFQRDIHIDEDADDLPEAVEKDYKWILSRRFFLKILMHYTLVIAVNGFFFYNMIMSLAVENSNNNYAIIGIGYFLCMLYLFFSAQQIRFGYPLVVDTRFFNSIDLPTVLMFRTYRAIPFLYEITSILDWTVSRTSLELRQWMLLEDAYAILYLVKYDMEDRKTHKPGETRPKIERIGQGCLLVLGLIVALILPMLLFSTLNPTSSLNNVVTGKIKIELHAISATNNYKFTLYQVENLAIQPISEEQADNVERVNPGLREFEHEQLRYVRVPTYSETEWLISLPSLVTLNILLGEPSVTVYIVGSWTFEKQNPGNIPNSQGLNAKIMSQEERNDLSTMLASAGQETTLVINSLFPKFIGLTKLAYTNLLGADSLLDQTGFNTNIELSYVNDPRGRYWKLKSYNKDDVDAEVFGDGTEIAMVVASDKAMASILNTIGALGIIGFYVTVTLAIGRLIRTLFDGISQKVIYEEIPDPNDLMELCDAIYMARKEGDYLKEEKLYNTLIRMLRSPELLLELTGAYPKEA